MFLPIRDQGQGRRRRSYRHGSIYTGPRAAHLSRFSLLSAITAQSSGSNGSNSTVTQESYNKSTRRKKSSRRKKETSRPRQPPMEPVQESQPEDSPSEKSNPLDVFSFLVDNGSVTHTQAGHHEEPDEPADEGDHHEADPEPVPYPEDDVHVRDFSTGSMHSDSGISMNDGSYVVGQAVMQPLPTHTLDQQQEHLSRRTLWHYPEVPKPQHIPFKLHEERVTSHVGDSAPHETIDQPCGSQTSPSVFTDSDAGFPLSTDHLASELAHLNSPPLFKAFRKANYRILLQLQDEIIELQEELAELDTYDGSRRLSKDASTTESLRRLSFHCGQFPFNLHKAKAEVLGRLQIRMDQYCS